MNGYICFVDSERIEVYASSSYDAQKKAVAQAKTRKKYPSVSVHLAELDGVPVVHVAVD